ncbi:winged helix-turn-helix transcriptional regulator [Nocardia altamirensis]|uniref:winged helix-turn-helix transcriptional regulator n=1 Tax=Nocardia altamirensis TaxID=472158 RepID=UPI001C3F5675
MLTRVLRALESDGLVHRKVHPTVPPSEASALGVARRRHAMPSAGEWPTGPGVQAGWSGRWTWVRRRDGVLVQVEGHFAEEVETE